MNESSSIDSFNKLLETVDATVWANAIMTGFDEGQRRNRALSSINAYHAYSLLSPILQIPPIYGLRGILKLLGVHLNTRRG